MGPGLPGSQCCPEPGRGCSGPGHSQQKQVQAAAWAGTSRSAPQSSTCTPNPGRVSSRLPALARSSGNKNSVVFHCAQVCKEKKNERSLSPLSTLMCSSKFWMRRLETVEPLPRPVGDAVTVGVKTGRGRDGLGEGRPALLAIGVGPGKGAAAAGGTVPPGSQAALLEGVGGLQGSTGCPPS